MKTRIRTVKFALKAFLILFTLLLSSGAFGVPYELYYSGRLTTLAGAPLEGPINIEIKFFRSESGADEIAVTVPAFTNVSLDEGTFALSIQLTPAQFHTVFPDSSSSPTYIQLKDTTHDQVYPRLVYTVVPYALKVPVDNSTVGYNSDGKLTVLNLGGDVTGAGGSTLVTKIQGNSVSNTSPASGEVLKWNGSSWAPSSAGGVGTITSVASGTGLTGGPITGSGTISVAAGGISATELASNAVTTAKITDANVTSSKIANLGVETANINTGAVTAAKIAVCSDTQILKMSGVNWICSSDANSGGTVTNVASGTGLTGGPINGSGTLSLATSGVTAGTYTKVTVDTYGRATSGTSIASGDLPNGIDAAKIGSGAVSNTEFEYLDGVTSAIQTQLNGQVVGPASATDNAIARFDGTTGKLVQNSGVVINDSGNVGIGTTDPGSYKLKIETEGSSSMLGLRSYHDAAGSSGVFVSKARGTASAPQAAQSGDVMARFSGSAYQLSASPGFTGTRVEMRFNAQDNFTDTANGTSISFFTTPLGGTATAETMRIDASGNVGIGSTYPTHAKLDVRDTNTVIQARSSLSAIVTGANNGGALYFGVDNSNSATVPTAAIETSWGGTGNPQLGIGVIRDFLKANTLYDYGGNTNIRNGTTSILYASANGNVGIGTMNPTQKLQVGTSGDGSVALANAWNTFSDIRLKRDLVKLPEALNKLEELNGYYYFWKDGEDQSRQVGVVAQEVEQVLPELVKTGQDGIKTVDYPKLTVLLIEATKQLKADAEKLKADAEKKDEDISQLKANAEQLKVDAENLKADKDSDIARLNAANEAIRAFLCQTQPQGPFCRR